MRSVEYCINRFSHYRAILSRAIREQNRRRCGRNSADHQREQCHRTAVRVSNGAGTDSQVELRGTSADNSTGTSVPLLVLAVAGLGIRATVSGLSGDQALIREIILKKLTAA